MERSTPPASALGSRLARAVRRAYAALIVEKLWPRLVVVASIVATFLALSWLGIWPVLPDLLRLALVAMFGIATLAGLIWAFRVATPSPREALKRLERDSGLDGRPLEALSDEPFDLTTDDGRSLWEAHRAQMAQRVSKLRVQVPNPRTERLDPWALRAPVLLVLVVAFFVAGPEREDRILAAFEPPASAPVVPLRIDVWATPPAYTGLPPRSLVTGADLGEPVSGPVEVDNLAATLPEGSRITVLSSEVSDDKGDLEAFLEPADGTLAPIPLERDMADGVAPASLQADLVGSATLVVRASRDQLSIPLASLADQPPSIRFEGDADQTPAGALVLSYIGADDYGIVAAEAMVAPADPSLAQADHLIEPPAIALTLPSTNGAVTSMTRDLSGHPWAGLEVAMQLRVTDGAEQTGLSEQRVLVLPERPFSDPLARAIVEQRRILAVDPSSRTDVLTMLESFSFGADAFMEDEYGSFLALTVTTQRLRQARDRDAQREIVEMLWQLALEIEDGDLAEAAERLRQAEQALSDALERGASEEEISALMDELRNAFEHYMQALAQQMQALDPQQAMPQNMPLQHLDPEAMQSMMDQIEQLAEMGAADAARQMLDQLRQQLDALRGAQAAQPREISPEEQAAREALQDLQAITREQRRLMDQTFPYSQDAQRPEIRQSSPFQRPLDLPSQPQDRGGAQQSDRQDGENGSAQDEGADPLDGLRQEQGDLQQQLQDLMQQLRDLGLDPGQLGEAEGAMGGAEQMLGHGSAQGALPEQGRALEALQEGAQQLAQQMMGDGDGQGQGQGQAQGQGQQPGQGMPRLQFGPGQGERGFDPLGRPQRGTRADNQERIGIPEERDIQRARDILQEIQRRLGERERPQLELDYLDRLIDRF